jgi:hypothetical protein
MSELRKPRRWIERMRLVRAYGVVVDCPRHGKTQHPDVSIDDTAGMFRLELEQESEDYTKDTLGVSRTKSGGMLLASLPCCYKERLSRLLP